MADLIYVAVTIAFFALAALYVVACDRIVGSEDVVALEPNAPGEPRAQRSAA